METPNFWASTYLSAAIIPPFLAATKHYSLMDPGTARTKSASTGTKEARGAVAAAAAAECA